MLKDVLKDKEATGFFKKSSKKRRFFKFDKYYRQIIVKKQPFFQTMAFHGTSQLFLSLISGNTLSLHFHVK